MEYIELALKLSVMQFGLFFAIPMILKKKEQSQYAIQGLL
jgi:hypothetical protein